MNPILQETRYNKRAGKETPVIRVYTTKAGYPMFFKVMDGNLRYLYHPYHFWAFAGLVKWKELKAFYLRITGRNE